MSGRSTGRQRWLRAVMSAVLLSAVLALMAIPAAGASAGARPWDFDGDGWRDSAVGVRGENDGAGGIVVFRGAATGLSTSDVKRLSQASRGVPGVAEPGDGFGAALASGDFDADGYADLAVGAPGEDTSTDLNVGAVAVLYGGADGLSGTGAHSLGRPDAVLGERDPEEDELGSQLIAADFDGDGYGDLAVAVTSGSNGLLIYRGRAAGMATQPSQAVGPRYGLPDDLGSPPLTSLAVGDLDGNGTPDLAIGLQEVDQARGAVAVVYSAAGSGLDLQGADAPAPQVWTEDSPGVKGVAADLDAFGSAVGITDVGGDGRKDLIVTVLQQPTSRSGVTGALHVLRGGPHGVNALGDQYLTYEALVNEPVGALGVALGVGDLNGDGIGDVAVTHGVHDASRNGGVVVVYGNASGLGTKGSRSFTQATTGIGGTRSSVVDYWGITLRVRNVGKSRHADLLVSDPYEPVGGTPSGMFTVLWGSDTGVSGSRSKAVSQDTPGVPGAAEKDDLFGGAL